MCIEKVLSYQFAGKLYPNEIDAVKAALGEIATRIIRDHSTNPFEGLLKHGADVSHLRMRYIDLACEETPQKGTTIINAREPKGERDNG